MRVTIAQLRAIGLTDQQIVQLVEEREAERREQNRKAQRNHRSRQQSHADRADRADIDILTTLPLLNSSLEKEERTEIVALATSVPKYPSAFEEFYRQYPRHEGKRDALKVWQRITKAEVTNGELIAGAMRYAADPNREPAYTKHCATWLNKGGWMDAPLPARGGQNGRKETPIEQAQRLADEWTRREHAAGVYGAADNAGGHRSRG
jgi:hypothetical protein